MSESIDARVRIGRSFAYRNEGLSHHVKLAAATGDEPARRRSLRRIEEVEAEAAALGYELIRNKYGRRDGIGQRMPTITMLVGDTLGEEGLYRVLSAMAHGHTWAVIRLGFQAPDAGKPTLLKKTMNSDAAAVLLMTAVDVLAKPLWAEARLFGYDLRRLKALLDRGIRMRWGSTRAGTSGSMVSMSNKRVNLTRRGWCTMEALGRAQVRRKTFGRPRGGRSREHPSRDTGLLR